MKYTVGEISDREFFKILKEKKVFIKFYVACSAAFWNKLHPRDDFRHYIDGRAKRCIEREKDSFLMQIRRWEKENVIKIQP